MKAEQKSNSWLILELLLVFVVMWFCYDYLNLMYNRYNQAPGQNTENTYVLEFGMKDEYKENFAALMGSGDVAPLQEMFANDGMEILERIKKMPYIESAAFSMYGLPYGNADGYYGYRAGNINGQALTRFISPEYTDVYKIDIRKFPNADFGNYGARQIIISPDKKGMFNTLPIGNIKDVVLEQDTLQVTGIAPKLKIIDYEEYEQMAFLPIDRWATIPSNPGTDISIRVKADADNDFIYKFKNDIQDKLDIGAYYFINLRPIEQLKEQRMLEKGYTTDIRNVCFVILFIVINVFLGIFGTFWFRTQSRRSEIGLRCAIGSSKRQINSLIMGEAFILLFIVSIPAAVIALLFSYFDVVNSLGVPSVSHGSLDLGFVHYLNNYLATTLILAVMIFLGTYFPAQQAMNIQPSEALKAE
jgi:putative ABC transport system permease protein